jgi:hypothetical protein
MNRIVVVIIISIGVASLVCSSSPAAGPPAAEDSKGSTVPLFNGKDLSGWHVTRCEAVVEDGAIFLKSGNGLVRTDHRYGDFVLELEWKALNPDRWDSGIYFRCELPGKERPWPSRYQANLLKGSEGNVDGLRGATSRGLVRDGEWNRFKLTVVGPTAELEINGAPAWKAAGIESPDGWIALQAEVPGGGQFLFRDVRVTELDHRSLFDGKTLEGWEGAGGSAAACWEARDGVLVCTGKEGPWLRSREQFADFDLRLEYRLRAGGNSGVYARVAEGGAHRRPGEGVEIQILDDADARYRDLEPSQFSGSVYAIAPATERVSRPAGEWNTLEIDCKGTTYRITHNGVVILDAGEERFPALGERRRSGFLGLQNHSEEVHFRRIRVAPR